ncbi:SDR family oxidoreductase [Enteractinococcus fodinae]|uniref:NAD(P)-dependent dehydrogenase (Short-subunit alcohol dehydrogenase family) n=1 Tax=Enteractinococcus fodinae TaxID=684663 RepID=A0ABU2B0K7_9MICC|nr:SDR family oxidoreductase [Enteractinococcus fodinae]MDR7347135.1 NAD(P)-dependent dehydrogenase (short-subunit alcohol dehydrogenase family) [Enteractinococcus fodinae]
MTQTQDLANTGIIVTGSSRGVGAATAQRLAARGAGVVINYRQKAPRANKVVKQIEDAGGRAVAVGADITTSEGRKAMLDAAQSSFGGLDVLVLNASGGMESDFGEDYAMRLNRDAQVAMLEEALEVMKPGAQIVYVTSHQAHFIDDVPTMPEYEPVAKSKRAGEVALRERIPALQDKGIGFVVVTADMIEGTITATLLNRMNPDAIESRRQAAGKLYTVDEFADEIAALVGRDDLEVGHTEYVGAAHDYFEQLKSK